LIVNSWV